MSVSVSLLFCWKDLDDCTVCGLHYFCNICHLATANNLSKQEARFFEVYTIRDPINRLHSTGSLQAGYKTPFPVLLIGSNVFNANIWGEHTTCNIHEGNCSVRHTGNKYQSIGLKLICCLYKDPDPHCGHISEDTSSVFIKCSDRKEKWPILGFTRNI